MTLVKNIKSRSTYAVRGLDLQVFDQLCQISLGSLTFFDDLPIKMGDGLFPCLQPAAKEALAKAIAKVPFQITINSALRSVIAQSMLYSQKQQGIIENLVAYPGKSDHQSGSCVDVKEWEHPAVKKAFKEAGWTWTYGKRDAMHFDYEGRGIKDIRPLATKAFQMLWNQANPDDKIPVDGDLGKTTLSKIYNSPAEGFADLDFTPRVLKLTEPTQQGKDVGALQIALREAGFFTGKADMVFGKETDSAVKAFQENNKLVADGIVGRITRKLLKI